MRSDMPAATPDEERTLRIVIEDWESRPDVQRVIALAVVRGHDSPTKAAAYLGMNVADVLRELPIDGILLDGRTGRIRIR